MARYIDSEILLKKLFPYGMLNDGNYGINAKAVKTAVENTPTADVVEVKHGEWELKSEIHTLFDDVDEEFYVECPFCHRTEWIPFEFEEEKMLEYARKHFPYCHCGAKMDGREQKNDLQ